jgi:hypothetical protein
MRSTRLETRALDTERRLAIRMLRRRKTNLSVNLARASQFNSIDPRRGNQVTLCRECRRIDCQVLA